MRTVDHLIVRRRDIERVPENPGISQALRILSM